MPTTAGLMMSFWSGVEVAMEVAAVVMLPRAVVKNTSPPSGSTAVAFLRTPKLTQLLQTDSEINGTLLES